MSFLEVSFSSHDLHKTADHHPMLLTQCLPCFPQVQTTPIPLRLLYPCISHSNLLLRCCCCFTYLYHSCVFLVLNFHINFTLLSHVYLLCLTYAPTITVLCVVNLVAYPSSSFCCCCLFVFFVCHMSCRR